MKINAYMIGVCAVAASITGGIIVTTVYSVKDMKLSIKNREKYTEVLEAELKSLERETVKTEYYKSLYEAFGTPRKTTSNESGVKLEDCE